MKNRLLELTELGADESQAAQRVFEGGLRVYTAMDQKLYWGAQAAVDSTVGRFAPFTAAMAVMNPRNGDVLAIVSGSDPKGEKTPQGFNLATMGPTSTDARHVGSTMKPITLATAIEDGYSPQDVVDGNAPCYIKYAEGTPGQPGYQPWYDTVKEARATSSSTPRVKAAALPISSVRLATR